MPAPARARGGWLVVAGSAAVGLSVLLLVVFALTGAGHAHPSARAAAAPAGAPSSHPDAGSVHGSTAPNETPTPETSQAPVMPSMPGMEEGGAASQGDTAHGGTDALGLGDEPAAVANLGVLDQVSDGRTMTVGVAEVTGTPGWVVVQRDAAGVPGPVVGLTRRLNGQHDDATTIVFTAPVTTGAYWVSLHRDLGQQRVYEYPGPDELATGAGADLSRRITLTVH